MTHKRLTCVIVSEIKNEIYMLLNIPNMPKNTIRRRRNAIK